ncbi:hypothetical protein HGRIS_012224 [Hohenbuehelia grisea]
MLDGCLTGLRGTPRRTPKDPLILSKLKNLVISSSSRTSFILCDYIRHPAVKWLSFDVGSGLYADSQAEVDSLSCIISVLERLDTNQRFLTANRLSCENSEQSVEFALEDRICTEWYTSGSYSFKFQEPVFIHPQALTALYDALPRLSIFFLAVSIVHVHPVDTQLQQRIRALATARLGKVTHIDTYCCPVKLLLPVIPSTRAAMDDLVPCGEANAVAENENEFPSLRSLMISWCSREPCHCFADLTRFLMSRILCGRRIQRLEANDGRLSNGQALLLQSLVNEFTYSQEDYSEVSSDGSSDELGDEFGDENEEETL